MELEFKPDFERAAACWNAFWARELIDRPPVVATVPRNPGANPGVNRLFTERYHLALYHPDEYIEIALEYLRQTLFLAEAIPYIQPDLGPDQYAAFFGASFKFAESSRETNWVDPIIPDLDSVPTLAFDPANPVWRQLLDLCHNLREAGQGRFVVGIPDLHSHMDALSALRGPQDLCMDLLDCPEEVEAAVAQLRSTYPAIYNGIYDAIGATAQGTIGWIPFWCPGRFATIQCDFIALVSPDCARRFILPGIRQEAEFLDHCIYHLDGPGALVHLDMILEIDAIDAVQWVPGDGQPSMHTWVEVLQRIQKAGKSLQIYDIGVAEMQAVHKELEPDKVAYCLRADATQEVEQACDWLCRHT